MGLGLWPSIERRWWALNEPAPYEKAQTSEEKNRYAGGPLIQAAKYVGAVHECVGGLVMTQRNLGSDIRVGELVMTSVLKVLYTTSAGSVAHPLSFLHAVIFT